MEINLVGEWKVVFDNGNEGMDAGWNEPEKFPKKIQLLYFPTFIFNKPFEQTKSAWCKKEFGFQKGEGSFVYLVLFMAERGKVWLNGRFVGELKHSAKKQTFDVTALIDSENTLIIYFDDLKPESLAIGKDVFVIENGTSSEVSRYNVTHTPKWVDSAIIYSIYTRNFTSEGTFAAAMDKIPYLKQLGVNTIWFLPIHEIGEEKRKGAHGSPYSIRDYYSVAKELGTKEDFKRFVDAAHEAGMKVIIDMVINHTSHDSVMKAIDQKFYKHPDRDNAVSWGWSDVTELDYSYAPTRDYIQQMMAYWIKEFDIDGYRCDVAFLVPLDFWKNAIDYLRSIKKDIVMLAESDSPLLYASGFDLTYDWGFMGLIHRMINGMYQLSDVMDYILTQYEYFPQNARRMICLENHDTPRISDIAPHTDRFFYHILKFITPGIPLIYNGEEFGAHTTPDLFEKTPVSWENPDSELFELYKILTGLKKSRSLNNHMKDGFDFYTGENYVNWIRRNMTEETAIQLDFENRCATFLIDNKTRKTVPRIIGEDSLLFRKNQL